MLSQIDPTVSFQSLQFGKQLCYNNQSSVRWMGAKMKIGGFKSCKSFICSPNGTVLHLCRLLPLLLTPGVCEFGPATKRPRIQLRSWQIVPEVPEVLHSTLQISFFFLCDRVCDSSSKGENHFFLKRSGSVRRLALLFHVGVFSGIHH